MILELINLTCLILILASDYNLLVNCKTNAYNDYKISSMYDVEVVSSKAEVLSVKDINK